MKTLLKIFIMLNLVLSVCYSQANDNLGDPRKGLESALGKYKIGEYQEAYDDFDSLSDVFPSSGYNSIFRIMTALSLYHTGDYEHTSLLLDKYISDFPNSTYRGMAFLYRAHSYYRLGRLENAAAEYMKAIDANPRDKSASIAKDNLKPLVESGLSLEQMSRLIFEMPANSELGYLQFSLGKRQAQSARYREARKTFISYLRYFPDGEYNRQARSMMDEVSSHLSTKQVIGLMAPLTGGDSDYGRSMFEGAKLALKSVNNDSLKAELLVRDTQGSPVIATKQAISIADEEPLAVVGPLESESSIGAGAVLNDRGIPMITPTASETGISTIGPNIFQISPPAEKIAQAIAAYAIKNLNITEFAIISPDDAGARTLTRAFTETVYQLGGEVVFTTYYALGAVDFKDRIMPLRDILLMKTEEQLASGDIDSSQFIDPQTKFVLDKDEWPVNLGGLFLPGYVDDLKLLIPQIRYRVIHTQFLGGDSWDSPELIREVKPYVGNACFATDFHIGFDETKWMGFNDLFKKEFGHDADKVAALTYDAVSMVISGLKQGKKESSAMRDFIDNIEKYEGVSGQITFKNTERANSEVKVYTLENGKATEAK